MHNERTREIENPGEGWDNKQALKHWADLCGPTAISEYLLNLLRKEIALLEPSQAGNWQRTLTELLTLC
jgi:hypothetical protein